MTYFTPLHRGTIATLFNRPPNTPRKVKEDSTVHLRLCLGCRREVPLAGGPVQGWICRACLNPKAKEAVA